MTTDLSTPRSRRCHQGWCACSWMAFSRSAALTPSRRCRHSWSHGHTCTSTTQRSQIGSSTPPRRPTPPPPPPLPMSLPLSSSPPLTCWRSHHRHHRQKAATSSSRPSRTRPPPPPCTCCCHWKPLLDERE
jgi:hypothetical protein